MDINDKSASDYDIKIVPNLLDELLASMQVNESTSPEIVQSIHALQDEIAVATKTIGSEHPHVLQLLRDLVEKYIDINHYSHAERLLRRLEKAYIRTYGTSHIQYIYQSIRLADTLQWQIRYDEAKEMYIRGLQLFLKYYDLNSIEDLIGHEYISPKIASERFLKSMQGQLRLQRRRKKRQKRKKAELMAAIAMSKAMDADLMESVDKEIFGKGEHKVDTDDEHSVEKRDLVGGEDDGQNYFDSYYSDYKHHDEKNEKQPLEEKEGHVDDNKGDYGHDGDDDDYDEGEDGDDDDEPGDIIQQDDEGHIDDEEIDAISLQSSIISLVSSTDGRALEIEEKYLILERLLSGLGLVYYQMKTFEHSETYYKYLLTLYYDVLYPYHPYHLTILNTINYLSLVMEAVNAIEQAEMICFQSYQDCELYYGPTHRLTLTAISTLARLLYAVKKVTQSEQIYLTAIERSLEANGERHAMTLELRTSLSILYKETGRYEESIDIVEKILLPQSEEVFGKYDIHTLIIYDQIGELYSRLRGNECLPLSLSFYQQAYDGKVIYYHTSHHPDVYTSQFLLGQIYHRMCSWKHTDNYAIILRNSMSTLRDCYTGVMRLYPSLSYHSLCLDTSLYFGQYLLQFNHFDDAEPVYHTLFTYYDGKLGMEKYILKPRNEHKRGSAAFLTRNSMIVSTSGKADIVALASRPTSPDVFQARTALVTPPRGGSRGTTAGMSRGGGLSPLRLTSEDLQLSDNYNSNNMFFSPFASRVSSSHAAFRVTDGDVDNGTIDAPSTPYWMSTMSGLNATNHPIGMLSSPSSFLLPPIGSPTGYGMTSRPLTRQKTPLPQLTPDKASLIELRGTIESRGRSQLAGISNNRIMEITSASRAMTSYGSSSRVATAERVNTPGKTNGMNRTAISTALTGALSGTLGNTRGSTANSHSHHDAGPGGAGKIKGNHMGICQGLTLNVRNIPTPPVRTTTAHGTSRMSSPVKITTTYSASYDALNAPTSPQTIELDYSSHPITNIQIAKKTIYEVHQTYTIPELLVYADSCYQLALLSERKFNYKQGYTYFTYAFIIYLIILEHKYYAMKVVDGDYVGLDGDWSSIMDEGSSSKVLTIDDGHRPDQYEVERATRSVISKMTQDETDSVFGSKNSGMSTMPKMEDYDRKRILALKHDVLEQIHHAEYLHLMCNNA